ncbi:MAG: radical SAM protein [Phycisphaera sp. RhM]|nr:radical SAM protein [Phycisphaera sp. RhM]
MENSLPILETTDHAYYSMTKSLCAVCKQGVDAKIIVRDERVFFDKYCPEHGHQECMVASSAQWYFDCLRFLSVTTPPSRVSKPVEMGCPFDCGACPSHQQKVYLPVIPITSACNLDCPICYTINKNTAAYEMTTDEMQRILHHLLEDHDDLDIINFTGGEPTLHSGLITFMEMCRDAGIRRLTVSTNGLKLMDRAYLEKLARLDVRVVLSFDTFSPDVDLKLLGANTVNRKLRLLDLLAEYDVTTTLLPAVAAGYNDGEVGDILNLVLSRPNICSLELHTMTFTGQGGTGFSRSGRITIPDLHQRIEVSTAGRIVASDFVPSPLAHPHCYSICYLLLLDDGGYIPFARIMPREQLYALLQDSLYIEPRDQLEDVFRETIDRLWASPDSIPESRAILRKLKNMLRSLYPADQPSLPIDERRKMAERFTKAIYIHSHMDEESFDVGRVMKCCVGVPDADGGNIPTCSYNVLYREKDPRFASHGMLERMTQSRQGGSDVPIADH